MTTLTPTQRLALGRLKFLHVLELPTRLGRISRLEICADEELAREILRATWPRAEEA